MKFTKAIGVKICERIAKGESLLSICRDQTMPTDVTVRRWVVGDVKGGQLADSIEEFRLDYARARVLQQEHYFEQIVEIADDLIGANSDETNAARVRIDARKWTLARMNRAKFGDSTKHIVGGDPDAPPVSSQLNLTADQVSDEDAETIQKLAHKSLGKGGGQ